MTGALKAGNNNDVFVRGVLVNDIGVNGVAVVRIDDGLTHVYVKSNQITPGHVLQTARDERDAAVSRNIQLRSEIEDERAQRVPIADYTHSVYEIIDKEIEDSLRMDPLVHIAVRRLEHVRSEIEKLPGWDGTEGGFYPGLQTTHYVPRSELDRAVEALKKIREHVAASGSLQGVDDLARGVLEENERRHGLIKKMAREREASR